MNPDKLLNQYSNAEGVQIPDLEREAGESNKDKKVKTVKLQSKICPLMSTYQNIGPCAEFRCAWYSKPSDNALPYQCAFKLLAGAVDWYVGSCLDGRGIK